MVYVLLVAIAAGAGVLLVLSWSKPNPSKAAVAEAAALKGQWEPTAATEPAKLRQIARYVAGRYTFTTGKQFAQVSVDTPQINGKSATSVVVEHIATGTQDTSATSDAVIYNLCGSNEDCTIPNGQTTANTELMERESIELALRTFRAQTNIHIVVIELPVMDSQIGRMDVYFIRDDLARANSQPLAATLPLKNPPHAGQADPAEAATLKKLFVNLAFTTSDASTRKSRQYVLVPIQEAMAVAQSQSGAAGTTGGTP